MKRLLKYLLPITALCLLAATSLHWIENERHHGPAPTESEERGEGHEWKKAREEWINNMHRTAPGVSWQAMDQATRLQKGNRQRSLDTLAGGGLVGTWQEVGSYNQAGRTHVVEPDYANNVLYLASAGGIIWKGPFDGNNWTPMNDRMQIPDIIMLRKLGNRLITASSTWNVQGVQYTDDDGLTWNRTTGLNNVANYGYIARAIVANDTAHSLYVLVYEQAGGSATSVYRSTDRGTSFSRLKFFRESTYGSTSNFDIWTDRDGSGSVYFMHDDSLFTINGSNFVFQGKASAPAGDVLLTGAEIAGTTYLYAAISDANGKNFFYSSNGGITWQSAGSFGSQPFGRNSFEASQTSPGLIFFGDINCNISDDYGANWAPVNEWYDYYGDISNKLHADLDGIQSLVDNHGNEVEYINTDGGLYRSTDYLGSVNNLSEQTLRIGQYYSTYTARVNTDVIYAGAQDQGMQISRTNSGTPVREFDQVISGDYGHLVSGDGGASFWGDYPGFVIYYPDALNNDNNITWDFIGDNFLWLPPVIADPDDPQSAYLAGGHDTPSSGSHLFHLTAQGGSIIYTELPYDFSGNGNYKISAFAISPINHQYQYVLNEFGDFFYSTNGGANWTKTAAFNGPGSHYFYGSCIVPSKLNINKVYIGGSGYSNPGVYASTDHGVSFAPLNSGLPSTLVFEMALNADETKLFAATEVGPYVCLTDQSQWFDLTATGHVPDQTYWTVDFIPQLNTARFGTYGRGIWDFQVCDTNSVHPVAQFNFSQNGHRLQFNAQTPNVNSYSWDFGNGTTSTDRNPVVFFDSVGTYHVVLTVSNGCTTDTIGQNVTIVATGIDAVADAGLTIFPNPSHGRFSVLAQGLAIQQLTVYDLAGKTVFNQTSNNTIQNTPWPIDLTNQPKGTYLLRVKSTNGPVRAVKLLVE